MGTQPKPLKPNPPRPRTLPVPVPPWRSQARSQQVVLVYRLSKKAQKEAWRAGKPPRECAQIQKKIVRKQDVDPFLWELVEDLVHIETDGTAFVFIGGFHAYYRDRHSKEIVGTEERVLGEWDAKKNFFTRGRMCHKGLWRWDAGRVWVDPHEIDQPDISAKELLEVEESRLHKISVSKVEAEDRVERGNRDLVKRKELYGSTLD